ncbi:Cysteine-rich repeat secretory protein 3 [Vitis vinifera]|uniref:Cysteine-rich repeat secretory protein 3 n=1 Tax=Vitis vinifera TaxID=29760 RepID=A0A438KDH8_VITVI|nr:Cysteine-rich repeat secretory protein 3 [Vitis vinifera]
MGLPPKPLSLLSLSLTFLTILGFFPSAKPSTDFTNLVYKGCADQKFQDPSGVYSKTLKPLFDSLVSQSSTKNFSTATSGEGQSSITGLYQCRGDLSNSQCYTCVGKLPDLCTKLCGKAIAARVQLSGCYMRYEVAGFKQVTATELLYKVCGSTQASQSGFEEKRDTTFGMMEKGVEGGDGFYTGTYESVYVLGSVRGHGSYSYYPTGVPSQSSAESGQSTEKTVALVVGGVAALGFGIACLMFVRTAFKKHHSSKY